MRFLLPTNSSHLYPTISEGNRSSWPLLQTASRLSPKELEAEAPPHSKSCPVPAASRVPSPPSEPEALAPPLSEPEAPPLSVLGLDRFRVPVHPRTRAPGSWFQLLPCPAQSLKVVAHTARDIAARQALERGGGVRGREVWPGRDCSASSCPASGAEPDPDHVAGRMDISSGSSYLHPHWLPL